MKETFIDAINLDLYNCLVRQLGEFISGGRMYVAQCRIFCVKQKEEAKLDPLILFSLSKFWILDNCVLFGWVCRSSSWCYRLSDYRSCNDCQNLQTDLNFLNSDILSPTLQLTSLPSDFQNPCKWVLGVAIAGWLYILDTDPIFAGKSQANGCLGNWYLTT